MSLVVFESVSLGFGGRTLVEDLNLRIGESDRLGLVGRNGTGKSSLLRMIAGVHSPDSGKIRQARNVRLGYLPQDIDLDGGRGLLEFVLASVPGRDALSTRAAQTQAELESLSNSASPDEDEMMGLATAVAELHERLGRFEDEFSEHEACRILDGLGFRNADLTRDLAEFSGGWKMRALLAALLFQRPDLLLLDEPTNHLDMPSVAWFGNFLERYRGAFILICHDREFLNEQINRVVSFEVEGVRQYKGDYERYLRQRAEEAEILANKAKNLEREREKAEQFITRFRAQANKAKAVQSRIKALEKLETLDFREDAKSMRISFPPCARAGNIVVEVSGLRKAYGAHVVFAQLSATVKRGEKVAILGVNGIGKTTLLKMIAGELAPDGGEVSLGHGVDVGYFAQHHADQLDAGRTVFESVAERDELAEPVRMRTILGAFLFSGDDVEKRTSVLSGGERARVALARLLIKPGNLLLMDEPTNHLDLESSVGLADALRRFDGSLMFVSHNRSFVRTVATQIWNVTADGIEVYPGTFDEWMVSQKLKGQQPTSASPPGNAQARTASPDGRGREASSGAKASATSGPTPAGREGAKERKRRAAELRRLRKQQVGPIEKRIEKLEAEIAELEESQRTRSLTMSDPSSFDDPARRDELMRSYREGATRLESLGEAWELAQAELEDAEAALAEAEG